jgi:hypothetical protein
MAADPATGQAEPIEASRQPVPRAVGFYGQSNWADLLSYRPDAPQTEVPPLTETYRDAVAGYRLNYPAGWQVTSGWQGSDGPHSMPTLRSFPEDSPVSAAELSRNGGQAIISIAIKPAGGKGSNTTATALLDQLRQEVAFQPGHDQYLAEGEQLTTFNLQATEVNRHPAIRFETMDSFGVVNHVLMMLIADQSYTLRGRGDVRLFEAVTGSFQD